MRILLDGSAWLLLLLRCVLNCSLNEIQRQNEQRKDEEHATSLRKHVAAVKHHYSIEQWVSDTHVCCRRRRS